MLSFVKFFSRVNALKMHDSMNAILLTYVNSYIACPKICQQCLRSKRSVLFFFFDMCCSLLGRESKLLIKYISTSFLRCEFSC